MPAIFTMVSSTDERIRFIANNTDARSLLAGNSMFIERQNTKQTTLSLEDMCTVQAIKDIKASRLENNPFTDIEKQELMNFLCTQ